MEIPRQYETRGFGRFLRAFLYSGFRPCVHDYYDNTPPEYVIYYNTLGVDAHSVDVDLHYSSATPKSPKISIIRPFRRRYGTRGTVVYVVQIRYIIYLLHATESIMYYFCYVPMRCVKLHGWSNKKLRKELHS